MNEVKKAANGPIIVVLMSGGPVDMTWAKVSIISRSPHMCVLENVQYRVYSHMSCTVFMLYVQKHACRGRTVTRSVHVACLCVV